MVQADHPPTDMAFDAAVESGGRQYPVGPMAWHADPDGIKWYAYDIAFPVEPNDCTIVMTPGPASGALLKLTDPFDMTALESVWTGPPLKFAATISEQRIERVGIPVPTTQAARERSIANLSDVGPVIGPIVRRLRSHGDLAQAHRELDAVKTDPEALLDLGWLAELDDPTVALELFGATSSADGDNATVTQAARAELFRLAELFTTLTKERKSMPTGSYGLGVLYEHGWGVTADLLEAKKCYRNAANGGIPDAAFRLAGLYEAARAKPETDPRPNGGTRRSPAGSTHKRLRPEKDHSTRVTRPE